MPDVEVVSSIPHSFTFFSSGTAALGVKMSQIWHARENDFLYKMSSNGRTTFFWEPVGSDNDKRLGELEMGKVTTILGRLE
jgi:hypothetical protein